MKYIEFKLKYILITILIIYLVYIKICNNQLKKAKNLNIFENQSSNLKYDGTNFNELKFDSVIDIIIKIESLDKNNLKKILNIIEKENRVDNFELLRMKEELHTYLWNSIFSINLTKNDLKSYKNLIINNSDFLIKNADEILENKKIILSALHKNLYPWIYGFKYKSLADIINTSNNKGFIICTPNNNFHLVKSNIEIFRNVFNLSIPIEIFYNGDRDLSYENRKSLEKFKNVFISDISNYFNNKIIDIAHWAIKPFAILASRFEEIILMDSDSFYLKDPSILFHDEGYLDKGILLFRDKNSPPSTKTHKWLKSFIKNPLPETKENRIWNNLSFYEIESSTVVIHKTKTLLGLLNVCKLNEKEIRSKVVYRMVYGDKETFWLGFEMSRQPYYVNKDFTVAIGEIKIEKDKKGKLIKKLCGNNGNIGHAWKGDLLYWNGHLCKDKRENIRKKGKYNGYFIMKDGISRWKRILNQKCFVLDNKQNPILFNKEQKNIISKVKYN